MATDSGSIRLGSTRAASDRSTRRSAANTLPMSHPAALLGFAVTCLLVLGLVMILSASSVSTYDGRNYGSSFLFFKKQLIWAMIGVGAYFFFARLDYHRLRNFGYASILVVGGLLLAVLIP